MTNRRDLLKLALTLPLTRVLAAAQKSPVKLNPICPPPTTCQAVNVSVLKILLAGPFAIILHKDDTADPPTITGVTAFTPVPSDLPHKFLFNGCAPPSVPQPPPVPNYQFEFLDKSVLYPNTFPLIDHGCDDFNVETDLVQDTGNHLVTITLPCPEQITFFGAAAKVTFSDGRYGRMPLNHVLQYRIKPSTTSVVLKNTEFNNPCLPQDGDTFSFEVGLPFTLPVGVDPKVHARDFFNGKLLPVFPHVPASEKLGSIATQSTSTDSAKRLERLRTEKDRSALASVIATAVECTGGGIIVTTTP